MCGRWIRASEGKEKLILDHAGNIERLGFPDDPLPDTLDMGEPNTNSDTRDRDEPTPWNCPKCHSLVPPSTRICPTCGHAAQRPAGVQVEAGVLQKIERSGQTQKQAVYAMLNHIRSERKYKEGWIANQYKEIFGNYPGNLDRGMTMEPPPALYEWIAKKRKNFLANKHIRENYRRQQ